jgi:hypothetical protein
MPNGKSLNIEVYSGTLASEKVGDDPELDDLQPKEGKVEEIWDNEVDGRVRDIYSKVSIQDQLPFVDSSNLNCDLTECIAYGMRETVRRKTGNIVAVVGTDLGKFAEQAIADAVDIEKLGDRSIIIVSSTEASPKRGRKSGVMWSQAGSDLTNAVYLSSRDEMRGKIAHYCGGILLPARGLDKIQNAGTIQPFISPYQPVTQGRNPPVYDWDAFNVRQPVRKDIAHDRNVLLPTGTAARYKLLPGIEAFPVDAISNYANILALAERGIEKGTLNGLIVPAPGKGDFRNVHADIDELMKAAQICLNAGVPFISISDPITPNTPKQMRSIPSLPTTYGSTAKVDPNLVYRGVPLSLVEAKMVVSESAHYGKKKEKLEKRDLIAFINEEVTQYRLFVSNLITHEDYMQARRARRKIER